MYAADRRKKFEAPFCERLISEVRWYGRKVLAALPEAITGVVFIFFIMFVVPVFFMVLK